MQHHPWSRALRLQLLNTFRSDGWALFNASYPVENGVLGGYAAFQRASAAVDAFAEAQAHVDASPNKVLQYAVP